MIPASHGASRKYVFLLFVMYVMAALGLLLTTSLMSLQRYLRVLLLRRLPQSRVR